MAVMVVMKWAGVTADQYQQLRKAVDWETQVPAGAVLHVASHGDGALHVADVWETPDAFDNFVQQRLMPAVQKFGITSQPDVSVYGVQGVFLPYPEKLKSLETA